MHNEHLAPGVLIIGAIALAITILSIYISRRYLPQKINKSYRKSIAALAAAVESRDSGSIGNVYDVAEIAVEIGECLGLNQRELERIEYAALLMEMGKAKVPQSILNKTTSLTADEWELVKNHSRIGAQMVAEVPFLACISVFILHHHEYWNGLGYPYGLTGEEIPLISRILHIAGDYVAMVSQRPYHSRAMDIEEALADIKLSMGVKYDPHICLVFLKMMSQETIRNQEDSEIAYTTGVAY